MNNNEIKQTEDELKRLQNKTKKLERELESKESEIEKETRERIADQLRDMGEEEASLKIHLQDLRKAPESGQKIRDRVDNLRMELEKLVTEMRDMAKEKEEDKEKEAEEIEDSQEGKAEEDTEKEEETTSSDEKAALIDQKCEKAISMQKALEDRIKQFDRIDRELSTKLEILESRRLVKSIRVWFGGFMIFIGGMVITAGLLLTLSTEEFPFLYSMFDDFFNPMLVFMGIVMVLSGFLQQA
jgi:chromosome segregation ATPase